MTWYNFFSLNVYIKRWIPAHHRDRLVLDILMWCDKMIHISFHNTFNLCGTQSINPYSIIELIMTGETFNIVYFQSPVLANKTFLIWWWFETLNPGLMKDHGQQARARAIENFFVHLGSDLLLKKKRNRNMILLHIKLRGKSEKFKEIIMP